MGDWFNKIWSILEVFRDFLRVGRFRGGGFSKEVGLSKEWQEVKEEQKNQEEYELGLIMIGFLIGGVHGTMGQFRTIGFELNSFILVKII